MRDDLILLASANAAHSQARIDKRLVGYSTIQFASQIEGALFVAYDEREWSLQAGDWFFPAHPGPRIRFRGAQSGDNWRYRPGLGRCPLLTSNLPIVTSNATRSTSL